MGMFDSIYTTLTCNRCNTTKRIEVQTKEFDCNMNNYEMFDTIPEAPFGDYWIHESWICEEKECETKSLEWLDMWNHIAIHLVHGLIVEVISQEKFEQRMSNILTPRILDTHKLITILQGQAKEATRLKQVLQKLYYLIDNTVTQKAEESKQLATSEELLDTILQLIKENVKC